MIYNTLWIDSIRIRESISYTERKDIMDIPENILNTLTDEQKKRIEEAKSPEDLLTIAKETGYELTDEQLEALSGGKSWTDELCLYFPSVPNW